MKKNCYNCAHLEWEHGDIDSTEGYICDKKDLYGKDERRMLRNMEREEYLQKGKVCFEMKQLKGRV